MHSYTVEIVQSPQNQSVCEGGTVNFTCIVMFVDGTPKNVIWLADRINPHDASELPDHSVTNNSYGHVVPPANITSVLTVTNVTISDNETDYTCGVHFNFSISDAAFLIVLGEAFKCFLHIRHMVCM